MVAALAKILSNQIIKYNQDQDREIIFYGSYILITNIIQIAVLLIISALFHITIQILFFSFFYFTLRIYAGGWHAPNHIVCLTAFTLIAMLGSWIAQYFTAPIILCLLVLSVMIVYQKAPMAHKNNPQSDPYLLLFKKKSRITIIIQTFIILALLAYHQSTLAGCAAGGSFAAAYSLLFRKEVD